MSDVLKGIERRIFQARGALYEGDVFSILLLSQFAIRSFEFGLADGAINCHGNYSRTTSWAERFWDVHDRRHTTTPRDLILFDVKSTVAGEAGEQLYNGSTLQQRYVAFFIGITAANPDFVDILPNYAQESSALEGDADPYAGHADRKISVNTTRLCKLPPSAYGGLDQCQAPYRLPIRLLPEAIARIRRCALYGEVYVNPGNDQAFPKWHPLITHRTDLLAPASHTDQHSAYELVLDILRFTTQNPTAGTRLDFVGVQPRLADFRLTVGGRTVWIQHKLDLMLRSSANDLSRVPAARTLADNDKSFFFSAFERFDFLWYQFLFSKGRGLTQDVFFFIPEKALPDVLYSSTETTMDLKIIQHLDSYRVVMDEDMRWLAAVERIIIEHGEPRAPGDRPIRPILLEKMLASTLPKIERRQLATGSTSGVKGRHEFANVMASWLRRFFGFIMAECAARRSDLLIVFATNHGVGELGFCRYRWTETERETFIKYGYPPKVAHELPSQTTIVPICCYTQYAETFFSGPNLRPAHFRRLNSSSQKRLIVWDLGGADTQEQQQLSPVIIPSDDINTSDSQRDIFARNVALDKNAGGQRENPSPNLSALLSTGIYTADYAVDPPGPAIFDRDSWASTWRLLDRFTDCDVFEHPPGFVRNPLQYTCTLQDMNESLKNQHETGEGGLEGEDY